VLLPSGELLVAGFFERAGDVNANNIAIFNLSPETYNEWRPLGGDLDSPANALAVLPGGDVIVGGDFVAAGGTPARGIARYNPTTRAFSALGGDGVVGSTKALAVAPGGDVIVGGYFTYAGGVLANGIARYNPTTNAWSPLGSGISGFNNFVFDVAVLPGGDVIAGGVFTTAGGVLANSIARYNPTSNTWSPLGSGIDFGGPVYALAVIPGGDVIVGGYFANAGGVPVNSIARYNPTTNTWSSLGSGIAFNGVVNALAVLPGGDVIVAGTNFATAGGVTVNNIARYNPTANTWSALGTGVAGNIKAITLLPGGDVIASGLFFDAAGGVPVNNIARYRASTNTWSALGDGVGVYGNDVLALATLPSGDLLVAGDFKVAGDQPASNFARYTFGGSTITTQPSPQSACPAGTATFSVAAGGSGPFTYQWRKGGTPINATANPSAATGTLTLTNVQLGDAGSYDCVVTTPCGAVTSSAALLTVASCACGLSDIAGPGQSLGSDGSLTADDIIVFLNWFFAGDTRADVAGAGQSSVPDSQFTADDIIVFLNRFFAGC
jgi:hypothetical protein